MTSLSACDLFGLRDCLMLCCLQLGHWKKKCSGITWNLNYISWKLENRRFDRTVDRFDRKYAVLRTNCTEFWKVFSTHHPLKPPRTVFWFCMASSIGIMDCISIPACAPEEQFAWLFCAFCIIWSNMAVCIPLSCTTKPAHKKRKYIALSGYCSEYSTAFKTWELPNSLTSASALTSGHALYMKWRERTYSNPAFR